MAPCIRAAAAILLMGWALAACTTTRTLAVAPGNARAPIYNSGVPTLIEVKRNVVIVQPLTPEFSKDTAALPTFFVLVGNRTNAPLDFSAANISATSDNRPVELYTYATLRHRIEHDADMQRLAFALAGGMQSMAAAMPQQSYTTGNAYAYGSGAYASGTYSGFTTTYNPAATAAAQTQIERNMAHQMAAVASVSKLQINSLGAMLRRDTIEPGRFAGGTVKLHARDIRSGAPLVLHVSIGGDEYRFVFTVGK